MKLNADVLRERLARNSAPHPTACRLWTGSTSKPGRRGEPKISVRVNGEHKKLYARRLAFYLLKQRPDVRGIITIRSLPHVKCSCGNGLCMEPSHLEKK